MTPKPNLARSSILRLFAAVVSLFALTVAAPAQQAGPSPVKIYIMVGQSNMVGHGDMSPVGTKGTLEYMVANDPAKYSFVSDGAGGWDVRDDVWFIDEVKTTSGLTAGLGASATKIGPELGFGHVIGNHDGNQVFIIKPSWGGKSLAVDFRPPSSGGATGYYYNLMTDVIDDAVANLGTYFPGYNGQGYEFAGFCWHQGYNDRVIASYSPEYETNMANFINDIRAYLNVPNLPFVIATTGMGGGSTKSEVENAQLEMLNATKYPGFAGNVAVIDTRNTTYLGQPYWQEVVNSPADEGHHWNRNAMTYLHIGMAMGDAMAALPGPACPSRLAATGDATGVTLTWQNGSETPASVQILRNGVEIAAAAPVVPASFLDTTAEPGVLNYQFVFTMPSATCDPLTVTFDAGITDLVGYRGATGVALKWTNNLGYTNIEVRRDNVLLSTIGGTATTYTDTTAPSTGSFTYSVVPTNGAAAETAVVVNLGPPSAGNALVYEPFDYAVGGLNGKSGSSETGLAGSWNAHSSTLVVPGSLAYSTLPTFGGSIGGLTTGTNRFGGARPVSASALSSNGLLNNGATLWFSAIVGLEAGGNGTNSRLSLALANSQFSGGNFSYWIVDDGAQLGEGVGVTLVGSGGRVLAAHFRDQSKGSGFAGNVEGNWSNVGPTYQSGEYGLIVGKIVWGAGATDTIQIYHPGEDMLLPATPSSTLTVDVNQANFDTITFARGDKVQLDEIRFAASYLDVTGQGVDTSGDNTAPTPGTMSFDSAPNAISGTAITMTAATASDANGVQYYFTCTAGGGHDSNWQDSPIYTDTGLTANTLYSYKVQARDKSVNHNTNTASPDASVTTDPADSNPPPTPAFATPPAATSSTAITMTASAVIDPEGSGVEYYFTCTAGGGHSSGWQVGLTYIDTGLAPNTQYTYTVKARDTAAVPNESAPSAAASATTPSGPSGPGAAVAYEPFDYVAGNLGTSNGGTGFSSAWTSNASAKVVASDLTYGSLATTGGSIGGLSGGSNNFGGSRTIDLTTPGLLANGTQLWFSVMMGYDSGSNRTNTSLAFVLGTEGMSGSNYDYNFNTAGATGLGVFLGISNNGAGGPSNSGTVRAVQIRDTTFGSAGFAGNVYGTGGGVVVVPSTNLSLNVDYRLVVGRITWGASSDTVDLFIPGTDLSLGSVHSTLTVDVVQAGFDTMSFTRGDKIVMDEIRFGASYESVIGAGGGPSTPYGDWASTNSVTGGFGGDDDLDGVANGQEWYYFNSNPQVPGSHGSALTGATKIGANTFEFSHMRPLVRDDVTEAYEWSADLGTWHANGASDGTYTVNMVAVGNAGTPYESVTVTATTSGGSSAKVFLRQKLTKP